MSAGMMGCQEAIALLWAYIDGELLSDEADGVRRHLDACAACFPQYDFHRAYRQLLRAAAKEPVPPDLRKRIFLRLLAEESEAAGDVLGGGPTA